MKLSFGELPPEIARCYSAGSIYKIKKTGSTLIRVWLLDGSKYTVSNEPPKTEVWKKHGASFYRMNEETTPVESLGSNHIGLSEHAQSTTVIKFPNPRKKKSGFRAGGDDDSRPE